MLDAHDPAARRLTCMSSYQVAPSPGTAASDDTGLLLVAPAGQAEVTCRAWADEFEGREGPVSEGRTTEVVRSAVVDYLQRVELDLIVA